MCIRDRAEGAVGCGTTRYLMPPILITACASIGRNGATFLFADTACPSETAPPEAPCCGLDTGVSVVVPPSDGPAMDLPFPFENLLFVAIDVLLMVAGLTSEMGLFKDFDFGRADGGDCCKFGHFCAAVRA